MRCGLPYPVRNGRQINIAGHYYNDTVQYVCDNGYTMTGNDISICQHDGYWSTSPLCKSWMKDMIIDYSLHLQVKKTTPLLNIHSHQNQEHVF